MDIKTRLEEEDIFAKRKKPAPVIDSLNKRGIYTVEDYINYDVEQNFYDSVRRKEFRAFQKILRYKYLGEPLLLDVILEKEISNETENIRKFHQDVERNLMILGFNFPGGLYAKKMIAQTGSCKIIDIILNDAPERYDFLKDFYIEYYNTKIKKENKEEIPVESDKGSLDTLKSELVSLLNQRNSLDTKISLLLEQINTLEGGKTNNARK